jgi:hypothetical protein
MTSVGRSSAPLRRRRPSTRLNQRLGTDRPLIVQYLDTLTRVATLNFGDSYVNGKPVLPQLFDAMVRSAKLAGLALLLTIPVAIAAGIFAARRRDRRTDRGIVLLGVTSSSIPEFVTGTVLVVVVGVQLKLLPVIATTPPTASIPTQIAALLMPATAMAIVYFGYIARMTRAGTIEVLQSDYTRTASMKGLTPGQVMRKHVPPQRVDPDRRRDRRPGRLPVRRHHRGREDLHLQRDGSDHAVRRPEQGSAHADGRGDHRGHRVHARDARRRYDHRLDEPADPTGRGALID